MCNHFLVSEQLHRINTRHTCDLDSVDRTEHKHTQHSSKEMCGCVHKTANYTHSHTRDESTLVDESHTNTRTHSHSAGHTALNIQRASVPKITVLLLLLLLPPTHSFCVQLCESFSAPGTSKVRVTGCCDSKTIARPIEHRQCVRTKHHAAAGSGSAANYRVLFSVDRRHDDEPTTPADTHTHTRRTDMNRTCTHAGARSRPRPRRNVPPSQQSTTDCGANSDRHQQQQQQQNRSLCRCNATAADRTQAMRANDRPTDDACTFSQLVCSATHHHHPEAHFTVRWCWHI